MDDTTRLSRKIAGHVAVDCIRPPPASVCTPSQ
jgi:hypothetical protein